MKMSDLCALSRGVRDWWLCVRVSVCVSYLINAYLCSQSLGFACDALIALHTFRRSGLKIE